MYSKEEVKEVIEMTKENIQQLDEKINHSIEAVKYYDNQVSYWEKMKSYEEIQLSNWEDRLPTTEPHKDLSHLGELFEEYQKKCRQEAEPKPLSDQEALNFFNSWIREEPPKKQKKEDNPFSEGYSIGTWNQFLEGKEKHYPKDDFELETPKKSYRRNVPVKQFDLDGDYITTYPNCKAASRATGVSYKNINSAINESARTAGGYLWAYDD